MPELPTERQSVLHPSLPHLMGAWASDVFQESSSPPLGPQLSIAQVKEGSPSAHMKRGGPPSRGCGSATEGGGRGGSGTHLFNKGFFFQATHILPYCPNRPSMGPLLYEQLEGAHVLGVPHTVTPQETLGLP